MQLYVETVHALGLPAPVGANILEIWRSAGSQGGDRRGYNSIIQYFERWAGVEVKG
jgi:3-hydroxyisobutyrate dehydrogenase-like beta-hydroxyacid dehydrogenase